MKRALDIEVPGRVVHVLGTLTDEVFSFLGPAAQAVARSGREQSVVMIDLAEHRHHMARLHESAELVLVPSERNPFKQWSALHQGCCTAMARGPLHAVHLHGLMPALVGAQAVRAVHAHGAPVFFSPHGSVVLGKLRSAERLLRALISTARSSAIVNVPQESRVFEDWASSELVESPVAEVFFTRPRREARHPLVITGGRSQSPRSAELMAQLAVLLGGSDLRIGFNWIGSVDAVSKVRLNAAGVSIFEIDGDADCAARLGPGWVYVAPGPTRGFPLFLAEAMAAGLPSVAFDCVQHRELIEDGESGFLCKTQHEMIDRIAALIDDATLRHRIGQAAQATARRRFGESQFGEKILAAYALE
ncbi:glycosyltransferase [Pelomonas sp. KK5]|uniref:glycosyltransferase n=1 Tax=Pelomonas sp. KK5 TaxID=1855730 RepID=UPI0009FAD7E6|nr:glycosyltransferase [Pelomonas sp. KK5]